MDANNGGNTRNERDVNNSRTPATAEHHTTALMLKTKVTEGTPTTKWTLTTVEKPGTEGMSTTAGPQQHQNAIQQH
jgi:hypothetical protein